MKKILILLSITIVFLFTSCLSTPRGPSPFDALAFLAGDNTSDSYDDYDERESESDDEFEQNFLSAIESFNFTSEQRYFLGREAAAKMLGEYNLYYNKELYNYLNSICQALVINSYGIEPYKGYHVAVLDTDMINAFATPGGHIIITRGLLNCTNTEDDLAAVIAHEVSHIQLDHSVKAIQTSYSSQLAAQMVGDIAIHAMKKSDNFGVRFLAKNASSAISDVVDSMVNTVITSGYSKETEFEADANAVQLMVNTGYSPDGMVEMLNLIKANSNDNSLGFGKTHPSPEMRLMKVKLTIKKYENDNFNEEPRLYRYNEIRPLF